MDQPMEILVITSGLEHRRALVAILNREHWRTICASTVSDCQELLTRSNVTVVVCDRQLPDGTYRDVLSLIHLLNTNVPLVVTSRLADWDEYFEVLQQGAFDLIASPCLPTDVTWVMLRAQREGKKRAAFIGRDTADKDMSAQEASRAEEIRTDGRAMDSELRREANSA